MTYRFLKAAARWAIVGIALLLASSVPEPAGAEQISIKLWTWADQAGPLRPGNMAAAAELLNKQFAAAGLNTRVRVDVHENNARGFDADAVDLLKAFAAGKGPDVYVAAHEWVGAFAAAGYAMNMERHIRTYPEYYGDIISVLWESVKYKGERYAIPQDSEIRMFFHNKTMLRKIGKSEAFIERLPERVDRGEFTIWDFSKLAKEVVDAGEAKYGIVHRPNVGADYLMVFAAFGMNFMHRASGKLLLQKGALREALKWFAWNAENGVTPRHNTAMSWSRINEAWQTEQTFAYLYGIWNVGEQVRAGWPDNAEGYFKKAGWIHAPASVKGGEPKNLSHPIVYVVNPRSPRKELVALLVAIASAHYFNNQHAVSSFHTGINYGQAAMPAYASHWALAAATPMLARSTFIPNHPKFGRYNAILFKGWQAVETGRLPPDQAVDFVAEEMESDLDDDVMIVD